MWTRAVTHVCSLESHVMKVGLTLMKNVCLRSSVVMCWSIVFKAEGPPSGHCECLCVPVLQAGSVYVQSHCSVQWQTVFALQSCSVTPIFLLADSLCPTMMRSHGHVCSLFIHMLP